MFNLRISANGQADLQLDHAVVADLQSFGKYGSVHLHFQNGGVWFSAMADRQAFADELRRRFPGLAVRVIKSGVRVYHPKALVARAEAINEAWQGWAAQGLSPAQMRVEAINHPAAR